MEAVNEGERVGLKADARGEQSRGASGSGRRTRGLCVEARGHLRQSRGGEWSPFLDVQAQQIRMQTFPDGDEMSMYATPIGRPAGARYEKTRRR